MYTYLHSIPVAIVSQLVFTDRINKRVYVTLDEGDSFTSVDLSFVPNKLVFQKSWAVNVAQYEDHILGYDNGKEEVREEKGRMGKEEGGREG